jgi:hypothetical protein
LTFLRPGCLKFCADDYGLFSIPCLGGDSKEQINLNDRESRIMPNSGKGFSQANNTQACAEPEKHDNSLRPCHQKFQ